MKKFLREFWWFGIKQAWACLFGACMLGLIVLSSFVEIPGLHRYDFLFLGAILIQVLLMIFKLETKGETLMIFVFHLVATGMELFKTSDSIGSWSYPGESYFQIMNVPLFAGFMYSAVGSYIARVWRIFEFKYTHYPNFWITVLFAALIYINFFTHHFWLDIRFFLLLGLGWIFRKCRIYYKTTDRHYHMPLILAAFLASFFVWLAENISTFFRVWIYPDQQDAWQIVSLHKLGAWFLLMIVSFVLVSSLYRKDLAKQTVGS